MFNHHGYETLYSNKNFTFSDVVAEYLGKMNIKPAFSFSIDMKLSEKGVAVGKYDGQNSSLTAITQSNKV